MKKRFGKLSKAEQEEIELEYHQANPDEFDEQMSKGKKHVADSIRLPGEMVETLKVMAESEGECGYQNDGQKMDRRTLASRSQEVDRRHKRVSKRAGRFSRYNTTPEVDQELHRAIWKALSSITESLVGERRVYGGGLHKLEPKALANVLADFILSALPRARDMKLYRQRGLFPR